MAKINTPTTSIVLDVRRQKLNKTYPVKLRITYLGKQRYYPTGINLTKPDFERMNGERPRLPFSDYKRDTNKIKYRADEIIADMGNFSFQGFDSLFLKAKPTETDLQILFDRCIASFEEDGKIGTASLYRSSINSLLKYKPGTLVTDITIEWLQGYEKWMQDPTNHEDGRERSNTIISIYLRNLRAVVNKAIHVDKIMREEDYPFGKYGYHIPDGNNDKRALSKADLKKIFEYEPPVKQHNENQY